ncbi:MAG: ImmA/IrrE family metallo-endopeptidase [Candidatus Bathyarchaeia archaeon]
MKKEREAEIFAAYYLIPEEKLDAILKQEWIQDSPDPNPELAEEFHVSENFMRKRLEFEKTFKG